MSTETPRTVMVELNPDEVAFITEQLPGVEAVCESPIHECMSPAFATAEILSVFVHSRVTPDILDAMPALKFIATRSTGYDHIDLETCNARGILVANVPRYGDNTVAEHTFALILSLSRKIHKAYQRTVAGDFSLANLEGFDLKGKTLGVVGAGSIGLHVIRIAIGFGMRVIAYDVKPNPLIAEVLNFHYVSFGELLANADIISLHAPLLPATRHMINAETITLIKRGALLINTARGGLVDTDALLTALDEGIISGAGLDVLEGEELIEEEERLMRAPEAAESLRMLIRQHILLRRPDVVITPHMSFYSREARQRILETTVGNIRAYLAGTPENVVNAPAGQDREAPGS
ncbi:MAG TPA: NAD(P)-dependent oxidoreductase [Armatimonadota bacterium]|nr:NAD(P)-dependent oxidoreductase [Armatimonadota bacterium]